MKSKKPLFMMIVLTLLITSCGNPPSTNQNGSNVNTNIEIQITGTESKELGTEIIPQPNCTGTAEVENTVEKSQTIQYIMEVQNGVSVNANGQVGFAGTDVELGATVASQFGQSYGTSETLTRSITVKAKSETNMQHVIRQVEIWKVGQAKISVGGQQTIIPFKFRSNFAIELANSQNLGCGTPQSQESSSNSTAIPSPIPTQIIASSTPNVIPASSTISIIDITNNKSYTFDSTTINKPSSCSGGYLETGMTIIDYKFNVPASWAVIIDSWKAEWASGSYQDDGILIITGAWQGNVKINIGAICAAPIELLQSNLEIRRGLTGHDGRPEFTIP